jgi:hypothetical protein
MARPMVDRCMFLAEEAEKKGDKVTQEKWLANALLAEEYYDKKEKK